MRKGAALAVAMMVGWLVVLPVASARAGTYDVVSCAAPGGDGVNRAWTLEGYNTAGKGLPEAGSFAVFPGNETCLPASGLSVSGTAGPGRKTVKPEDGAAWTFRAPAGTTVRRVKVWRYTAAATSVDDAGTPPVEDGIWAVIARVGTDAGGATVLPGETCSGATPSPMQGIYCRTGEATFNPNAGVTYDNIGQPVVSWGIQCTQRPGVQTPSYCFTGDSTSSYAGLELRGADVTVEDLAAPDVSATGLGDGWLQPGAARTLVASDVTGIRQVRVLVDGVERVSERYDCDYHLPAPCAASRSRGFDLAGVTDGRHTITLIADDAASNTARIDRPVDLDGTPPTVSEVPVSGRTITALVSDAGAGVAGGTIEIRSRPDAPFTALKTALRGGKLVATVGKSVKPGFGIRVSATDKAGNAMSAVVTSMSLSTRLGGRSSVKVQDARATVPYGRSVTVLGRLTSTDGAPIAGQPIAITGELHQTGAKPAAPITVTTDGDGRFSLLVPAGPSRELTVVYPGSPGVLTRTRTVALRVPASATIHASKARLSGAGAVRFSGRLRMLGTSLPPGGKIVDLQASQRGRWTTVDTARAGGRDGTWHATARFRGNAGRFPIRLRIRREALFPYELGYSASVVITVR